MCPPKFPHIRIQVGFDQTEATKNRQPAVQPDGLIIPDHKFSAHAARAGLAARAGYIV